ncbi:MAG: TonB-dependent receptor [Saprospiraceae bacterium]|nr:TonB-dependent receptor [Saprospiraceae bacterium]MDZ4702498.1 TonB-dependent receptor [Saprospiraceae bacterium]
MTIRLTLLLLLSVSFLTVSAQEPALKQTLRGRILDADTRQPLVGATVSLLSTGLGATTDTSGAYRMAGTPVGRYQLQVSYVGYASQTIPEVLVESGKETVLDIELQEQVEQIGTVVVRAARSDAAVACPTVRSLSVEETLRFPATFYDPARLAATFAGVVNDNDQANGLSVRGNSPNGTIWRLEGLDIVNPNHTPNAGTFSDRTTQNSGGVNILSAQLLDLTHFYAGPFPAGFGNALSGVMDTRLRKGNSEQREFTGQASLIGLDLAAEGPFSRDSEAAYLVNYRYSTIGLLSAMGLDLGDEAIRFQDLSFNLVFPGSKGVQFTLFGVGGQSENIFKTERDSTLWEFQKDRYDITFESQTGILGATFTLPVGTGGLWHTALGYSILDSRRYGDRLDANYQPAREEEDVSVQQKLSVHSFYNQKFNARSRLRTGLLATRQNYDLLAVQAFDEVVAEGAGGGWWIQPYATWQQQWHRLTLNAGLQASWFTFNETGAIEPRLSLEWKPTENQHLSIAYGLHSQLQAPQLYFAVAAPQENRALAATKAHHLALSYRRDVSEALYYRVELYHQDLFDVPVSATVFNTFSTLNLTEGTVEEALVNSGTGRNYGAEITVQQRFVRNLYYLVNATWYTARYKGSDLVERRSRFDGAYAANATIGKEWERKPRKGKTGFWGANIRAILSGGLRDTPIDEAASAALERTVYQTERAFELKLRDYFRVDLRLYYRRNSANSSSTLALDIQNASNQQNVAFSYYDAQKRQVVEKYQLGLIPVLSYRIAF